MGTWGVNLYQNDTACDVRDTWLQALRLGAPVEEATAEVLKMFEGDDDPLLWLALADTQWTWGRLDAKILERAERALSAGGDLALWDERPKDRRARARVFDRLAARLKQSPPPPKAIRARTDAVEWKRGQLWAYHTLDDKYVVFRVAGFDPASGLVGAPVTELLDVVRDTPPRADTSIASAALRPARADYNASGFYDFLAPEHRASPVFQPKVKRRGELPRHRLKKLGAVPTTSAAHSETLATGVAWDSMDEFLPRIFDVGGLRPGAVLRWPLAGGDVGYTMVEFGHWPPTLIKPMWQLAVLDCRGEDVDATAIEKASITNTLIVDGFLPPGLRESGLRPIKVAQQASGAVYTWDRVPQALERIARPTRPRTMNIKEANEMLAAYVERYRGRSYADLAAVVGTKENDNVTGPSGAPYVVEVNFVWADKPGGAVQVMCGLDDGRAEKPVYLFRRNLTMSPDGKAR